MIFLQILFFTSFMRKKRSVSNYNENAKAAGKSRKRPQDFQSIANMKIICKT